MYTYRQLTKEQQREILNVRKRGGLPWHAPPHFGTDTNIYLLTAACFEHKAIIGDRSRRDAFYEQLIVTLQEKSWADVKAWVILPNHYHILATLPLPIYRKWIGRLHNQISTVWNGEDKKRGRKVWYRFSDRAIRGERHYLATINYVHANSVRH